LPRYPQGQFPILQRRLQRLLDLHGLLL
jgi:hypothetical protein